jgi:hypothetical protein
MLVRLKHILSVLVDGALLLWALTAWFLRARTMSGTHLSDVTWLPPSASEITYLRREGFCRSLTYERTISESDFVSLARKEGWEIREASDVSVTGLRHLLKLPDITNEVGEIDPLISNAFSYERRQKNNGGTTVAYDRDRKRLFFHYSNR